MKKLQLVIVSIAWENMETPAVKLKLLCVRHANVHGIMGKHLLYSYAPARTLRGSITTLLVCIYLSASYSYDLIVVERHYDVLIQQLERF